MSQLVSIIMPVLNGECYISEAIKSVLAQRYPHWELVVIDDGSTDHTAAIVQAFGDPRIRYAYQENRGQAAALNHGLDLAQGEYITTLDADDIYPPNSLEVRVAWLDAQPAYGAVYGDGYYCNDACQPVLRFAENRRATPTGDIYGDLIVSPLFGTGANVMQRRGVMEQYQIQYDESIVWCQDWDLYIRLAEKTLFGYVDAITVLYRIHSTNMSMKMPEGRRLESLIRTKRKVLAGSRMNTVSNECRSDFFYLLLVDILRGRAEEQVQSIDHPQFRCLPKTQQSRLLRLMANGYLLAGDHHELAREWLQKAWRLAPLDAKTGLLAVASTLNIELARVAINTWRNGQDRGKKPPSPFELAFAPISESPSEVQASTRH